MMGTKMTLVNEVKKQIAIKHDLAPPAQYKVIFLNDNVTTLEFVIEILETVFHYDTLKAKDVTLQIHDQGLATVAIMPYELAEQKALETTALARSNGFPLNVKLEPNS